MIENRAYCGFQATCNLQKMATCREHLSALLFKRLFLNHSNKPLDACSKDVIRSSTLLAIMHGVLSFAVKSKSNKKTLNSSGPSIQPCGTPNTISNIPNIPFTVSILNLCSMLSV